MDRRHLLQMLGLGLMSTILPATRVLARRKPDDPVFQPAPPQPLRQLDRRNVADLNDPTRPLPEIVSPLELPPFKPSPANLLVLDFEGIDGILLANSLSYNMPMQPMYHLGSLVPYDYYPQPATLTLGTVVGPESVIKQLQQSMTTKPGEVRKGRTLNVGYLDKVTKERKSFTITGLWLVSIEWSCTAGDMYVTAGMTFHADRGAMGIGGTARMGG